ncbi:hypothetical protein EDB89DRAFT_2243110, partial [Lactarius sanguifluus]
RVPQCAAPTCSLSDSSVTSRRPRRLPLQGLHAALHSQQGSVLPIVLFLAALHSRAALAIRRRRDRDRHGPRGG